jgi:uncharacterized phosphosugar-binding protein
MVRKMTDIDVVQNYFSIAVDLLNTAARESAADIRRAGEAVADALQADKDFLLFGSGHSALIARDAAGRAGGLMAALAIEDLADGDAERIEGVAKVILGRYVLREGSVIVIISNSGINPVTVEMATLAKNAGLKVIAITSISHSQRVPSRHSSGKKLYELADIAIDTHAIPGDAAIELPGTNIRVGATSTLLGSAIIQAVTVHAANTLVERGFTPPVFISANVVEGDAHNRALLERYKGRLVRYQLSLVVP